MLHHRKALMIIISTILRIPIPGLAVLVEGNLSITMRPINSHERLSFGLEKVLLRIVKPTIDKVAMEAIAITNLLARQFITHLNQHPKTINSPHHKPT